MFVMETLVQGTINVMCESSTSFPSGQELLFINLSCAP